MNLNYEEFKEKIKEDIKDYMDEKYKDCGVVIRKVNKTNREVDGLNMLDIPGLKNATPTLYVNDLYEKYEKTGDYEEVARMAAETMEYGIKSFNSQIKEECLDTSKLKDKVFFSLINAEQNRELLNTVPHREFEDLAIVYRWNIGSDSMGTYTNLVNNDLAEKEGLTENDLYNAANKNTKELFPVLVKNMNEVISEIIFGESELGEEMQEEFNEVMMETPNEHSMYVITNESKLYGAASILYEEPLHELAEKVGSDLYILPSSVHEVIAVSADFSSPDELAEMVYEINMDQVDINDRLSNQVSIRLVKERPLLSEEQLTSPEKVAMVVGDYIRDMDREALCVINFNSKLQPLNFNLVSIGAIDTTIASPREILKSAILSNAANMMILHNHPSNILEPSKEDIRTTAKLVDICNLVGIPLLDHIIVGPDKGRYFSLRDKQLVDFRKSSTYSDKLEFLNFKKDKDIKIAEEVKVR